MSRRPATVWRSLALTICILLPILTWITLHDVLYALAQWVPNTFTERLVFNWQRRAFLLSAIAVPALVWYYRPRWRWIWLLLVLALVTTPFLFAAYWFPHGHCWEPGRFLEQPSIMADVPCE
ncbi:archaellum biogenesis protein FlaJ (TadC family) [Chitinivorax tropicus]|uniref:Archaellum biogenesis protein FlaJ (TadC family) n=1 Tax=Chitinivorax tropicus TaxID=714531 RepID=A0A840MHB7_9PROT|nr:hypothetical protein [Chitinivorax tropicus]MBB5018614.1 archaellum biogenesis protein FlaJ (TadC family) [Chitinivorax tropicus]